MSKTITNDEVIAHFGVLGMHWGRRKGDASGGSGGSRPAKKPKPTRDEIITARRLRRHLADKSWDIHDKMISATTEKGRAAALKELEANDKAWDSAHATAKKLTGGEKVASVLLWSGAAISVGATIGSAIGGSRRL